MSRDCQGSRIITRPSAKDSGKGVPTGPSSKDRLCGTVVVVENGGGRRFVVGRPVPRRGPVSPEGQVESLRGRSCPRSLRTSSVYHSGPSGRVESGERKG